ncbi:MAG: hypothetical protein AAF517_18060 [Planctomycetota bacterium]
MSDTVTINSGQGIECGFGSPNVDATRCYSVGNLVGARFGDNYDWDYDGFLTVTDSLLLYNFRDIWGRAWDNWDVHSDQMDVQGNLVSTVDPDYPGNPLWDPETDASRLAPYLPTPAGSRLGIGLGVFSSTVDAAQIGDSIPVGLSRFAESPISVSFRIADLDDTELDAGTLNFEAGQSATQIPLSTVDATIFRVTILDPVGADLTGLDTVLVAQPVELISLGSVWKYLDTGVDQGTEWRELDFDDSAWPSGAGEFGYGDDDETTEIEGGPEDDRYPTTYFRRELNLANPASFSSFDLGLRRDDGAVVYLNGVEIFRSNMPDGEILYETFADGTTSSEDDLRRTSIDPSAFRTGRNVFAVEVHQADESSSDVSFDFELIAAPSAEAPPTVEEKFFLRGDVNGDERIDISDPVLLLLVLFAGRASECDDALDVDDSGTLSISDAIYELNFLFRAGSPMAAPYPETGIDPTFDALGCARA